MSKRLLFCAAGVLGLAGCAKPTPPPAPSSAAPVVKGSSPIALTISPTPLRSLDTSTFIIAASDDQGRPLSNGTVIVDLTMTTMEMPKNEVVCRQTEPGKYSGTGRFTMSGDWLAHVSVKSAGSSREQNFPLTVK